MTSTPMLPKAPFLPALGAVLVSAWPAFVVLTVGLELSGGGEGPAALLAVACAAALWVPLLRACVKRLTAFTVSYATAFGVLVAGTLLLVPLAVAASFAGTLGATVASGFAPPLLALVLRHHVDFEEPPMP